MSKCQQDIEGQMSLFDFIPEKKFLREAENDV